MFHAFCRDEDGHLEAITLNARVSMDPIKENRVVVTDDHHKYVVDFALDPETEQVTQYDYEGDPLKFYIRKRGLLRETEDEELVMTDNAKSPMPGTVVKCFVKPGDSVKAGDSLMSIESMKMEYIVKATHDQTVKSIEAAEGQFVEQKQRIVTFE